MRGLVYKGCTCPARLDSLRRKITCGKEHGSWSYKVDLTVPGAPRHAVKGGFSTKREAEEALAELISRAARGQSAVASRVPLGEYLDEWLATVRPSLAAAAWTVYCDDVATERQCVHRLGKANLPCTLWNDFDLGPTRTHERACSAPSR